MKKKVISVNAFGLLILMLFSTLFVQSQERYAIDRVKEGLRGKVKMLKETNYKAEGSGTRVQTLGMKSNPESNFIKEYNPQGRLILFTQFNAGENITSKEEYSYNARDQILHFEIYDASGTTIGKEEFKYDTYGNCNEYYRYSSSSNVLEHHKSKYDKMGRRFEHSESYDGGGYLNETVVYDTQGRKAKVIKKTSDSEEVTEYKYENGKLSEESFKVDGITDFKKRYIYKENFFVEVEKITDFGNSTEIRQLDDWDNLVYLKTTEKEVKFDSEGREIEVRQFKNNGELEKITFNKFDKSGNILESKSYNSDGNLAYRYEYHYVFDEEGNFTKKIKYNQDGKAEEVFERQIAYF